MRILQNKTRIAIAFQSYLTKLWRVLLISTVLNSRVADFLPLFPALTITLSRQNEPRAAKAGNVGKANARNKRKQDNGKCGPRGNPSRNDESALAGCF